MKQNNIPREIENDFFNLCFQDFGKLLITNPELGECKRHIIYRKVLNGIVNVEYKGKLSVEEIGDEFVYAVEYSNVVQHFTNYDAVFQYLQYIQINCLEEEIKELKEKIEKD